MLRILGAVVILGLGYALNENVESTQREKRRKLARQQDDYEEKLSRQYDYNEQKKRSILFKQIKHEQSKLQEERRELAKIRNSLRKGSLEYKNVVQQIAFTTQKIEQKQKDADRVRGWDLQFKQSPSHQKNPPFKPLYSTDIIHFFASVQ